MKCCNRPTLSIIVGLFHTILFLLIGIYCTNVLVNYEESPRDQIDMKRVRIFVSILLAISLVIVVVAIIMIVGVVTKRYLMILPYLWVCITGIWLYVGASFYLMLGLLWMGAAAGGPWIIAKVALVTGVQVLILLPICSLYKEWRAEARGDPIATQTIYATLPVAYQNIYKPEKPPTEV